MLGLDSVVETLIPKLIPIVQEQLKVTLSVEEGSLLLVCVFNGVTICESTVEITSLLNGEPKNELTYKAQGGYDEA